MALLWKRQRAQFLYVLRQFNHKSTNRAWENLTGEYGSKYNIGATRPSVTFLSLGKSIVIPNQTSYKQKLLFEFVSCI